jgi:hypothetical protein
VTTNFDVSSLVVVVESRARLRSTRISLGRRMMSLTDVAALHIIWRAGADRAGRPIVALAANRLPGAASDAALERVLLYVVRFLDQYAARPGGYVRVEELGSRGACARAEIAAR